MSLNLSSQPFVNSRPVRRLVLVLWCLSALLVIANAFFYARHLSGQQTRHDRLAELSEQEGRELVRLSELDEELAAFDLDWQKRQVEFLNVRIAERVFPWSRLFDRLTEALPRQVRLTMLRPEIHGLSGNDREETVRLEIRADARSEEAMLSFVGKLFEHPAFRNPNLASENRRADSSVTQFSLTVTYLPARAVPAVERESAPAVETAASMSDEIAAVEGAEGAEGGENGGAGEDGNEEAEE